MMHGVTFRGVHSSEIGVIVKTVGRPITPPVRQEDEEVPHRDGSVDVSEAGGRLYYDDKILELEFSLIGKNSTNLQSRVTKFINWLSGGYSELIFDDMPYVVWLSKPLELDKLAIERFKHSKVSVQFRCRPFNKFLYSSQGIPLGSDIPLGSKIPIGWGDENYISFDEGESIHNLYYEGSAVVRPKIDIFLDEGTTWCRVDVGGSEIYIKNDGENRYIIDCENGYMPNGVSGEFSELSPGDNEIKISADGCGTVFFDYRHNFLYGEEIIQ